MFRALLLTLPLAACATQPLPYAAKDMAPARPAAAHTAARVQPLAAMACNHNLRIGEAAPGRLPAFQLLLESCRIGL